jgi:hypothetical protein
MVLENVVKPEAAFAGLVVAATNVLSEELDSELESDTGPVGYGKLGLDVTPEMLTITSN